MCHSLFNVKVLSPFLHYIALLVVYGDILFGCRLLLQHFNFSAAQFKPHLFTGAIMMGLILQSVFIEKSDELSTTAHVCHKVAICNL